MSDDTEECNSSRIRATELEPLKPEEAHSHACQNKIKEGESDKEVKNKLSLREKITLVKRNITVEPILCLYIMSSTFSSLATQNLNLEKGCRVNLNFTTEICDALTLRETANFTTYETEVQTLIATIETWKTMLGTVVPCFLILFVGAWSDKTGRRKVCILMPIVGELLSVLALSVNYYYYLELPVEVSAVSEVIFPALTGGWFTNFIGIFSYIGDITTPEERTFRLGLVNLCSTLGTPIGSSLSGILLAKLGCYGIYGISAVLYILIILYGIFYLEEPTKKVKENRKSGNRIVAHLSEFFDINLAKETFAVALKKGPRNRRLRVFLLLVVVFAVFGPMYGEYSILYLFARFRFNWNEVQFSIWSTYCIVTNFMGTMFSISLFSNYLKVDDTILGIISNTSKIVASFAYAFARNDLEIYLAPLLEMLNGTSFIAMRSIASKLVSSEELGKVNSLFGLAEAATPLLYRPMYTTLYMATLNVLPGAIFLLGAALTVPAIVIFGWLYIENRKDRTLTREMVKYEDNESGQKPREHVKPMEQC